MNDTLLDSHEVKAIAAVGQEGRGRHSAGKCQSLWIMQAKSSDSLCSFYHCSLVHQQHLQSSPGNPSRIPKISLHHLNTSQSFGNSLAPLQGWADLVSLTHPLWVFNLKLSFSACSAVGLAAMSGLVSASPEGLQKACTFVFFKSKSVCGHSLLHTWGYTECPELVLSFPQPERLSRQIVHHRDCNASPSSAIPDVNNALPVCSPPALPDLAAQHPGGRGHPAPLHKAQSCLLHLPQGVPRECPLLLSSASPLSADGALF